MTSTSRTRLFLILIAALPPLLMMSVIYFYSLKQYERRGGEKVHNNLQRFIKLDNSYLVDIANKASKLAQSPEINKAIRLIKSGHPEQVRLAQIASEFNIVEILDTTLLVLASDKRPGLIGENVGLGSNNKNLPDSGFVETVEYDIEGRHASYSYILPIDRNYLLYTCRYVDGDYTSLMGEFLDAEIEFYFNDDINKSPLDFANMTRGQIFQTGDTLMALLGGGENGGYVMLARFDISSEKPIFLSLLKLTGVVAILSVGLAVLMGIYITGQSKKEIGNLIEATRRIADGDLTTPVMAYEEGEFSELADSFTEMKTRLRKTLSELSTTEKIAAWKEMGQKIAHEVKNPLTPISISIDDLRRSYYEKLPDFERTIDETTTIIKTEIDRLILLLDQFVRFARMEPPIIKDTKIEEIFSGIERLYQHEIESGRLMILNHGRKKRYRLDPEKVRQVLINLIKNGLEVSKESKITVNCEDSDDRLEITVEDTGPGFLDSMLDSPVKPYTSTKKGGAGLGLVISARIIHDHGGTMKLYNRAEAGGGIKINLPA